MKWPKLKRDHIGLKVSTVRPLANGWGEVPTGTVCTITYSRAGLSLKTDPCKCCGVRMSINNVPYSAVELIALEKTGEPGSEYNGAIESCTSSKIEVLATDNANLRRSRDEVCGLLAARDAEIATLKSQLEKGAT